MQKPEPLDADWSVVQAALVDDGDVRGERLIPAMLQVAAVCADAIRSDPTPPLTAEEQQIIDEDRDDDPRFYDLLFQQDMLRDIPYVLEWYDKTIALVRDFIAAETPDPKVLSDGVVMCWDHIVPEYHYHQLAHIAALTGAKLMSRYPVYHDRTWLYRMTDSEYWALFLGLAQQLEVLEKAKVKELAVALTETGK